MKMKNFKQQKGQGFTEYLVLVGLIAVVSIAGVRMYGSTVVGQMGGMAQELAGTANTGKTSAQAYADAVASAETLATSMVDYDDQDSRVIDP